MLTPPIKLADVYEERKRHHHCSTGHHFQHLQLNIQKYVTLLYVTYYVTCHYFMLITVFYVTTLCQLLFYVTVLRQLPFYMSLFYTSLLYILTVLYVTYCFR